MNTRSIVFGLLLFQSWCVGALAGSLEYWKFDVQQSRLEIITEDGVKPQAQLLSNPTRLVIDLPGVTLKEPVEQQGISSYVQEVRLGQFNSQTTRIVVELASDYTIRPWEVKVRGLAANRWYVQLPKFQTPDVYTPPPNQSISISVPPPQSTPTPAGLVIVIDPGHGGRDPGAIGLRGLYEKTIVLSISLQVAKLLEKQGFQVVMTRNNDRFVSLKDRVAIAENSQGRGFISIHANAVGGNQSQVNGLETYYYDSGYNLAQLVHRSILRRVSVGNRGTKKARFYVIRKTSMPAILIEVGFVTGTVDSRHLSNPSYRQRIAEAIADGITEYFR